MFFLAESVPSMDLGTMMGSMAGLGILAILLILVLLVGVILLNTLILWFLAKVLGFEHKGFIRAFAAVIVNLIAGFVVGIIIAIPFSFLGIPLLSLIVNSIVGLIVSTAVIKFIMGADWVKAFIAAIVLGVVGLIVAFVLAIILTMLFLGGMFAVPYAMG